MSANPVHSSFHGSLSPWLSVRNGGKAVEFYQLAFGAVELFHLEDPDGNVVSQLSIGGSELWLSDESPENGNYSPQTLGGSTVRLILTVENPDEVYEMAVSAGATQISPVGESNGWRTGRILDPFGHSWEIGRPI